MKGHRFKNCLLDKKNKLEKSEQQINKSGNKNRFDKFVSKKKLQFASDQN